MGASTLLGTALLPGGACAQNVDPEGRGARFAFGSCVGWLNARPLGENGPGVHVADSQVTGYLWAENLGWISLSCENTASCDRISYGVVNDGRGHLSGYGWAEGAGWVSFSCENTASCSAEPYGVTVDPASGRFSGEAWSENAGWFHFGPDVAGAFAVITQWRPPGVPPLGDLDDDCVVTQADVSVLAANFGQAGCAGEVPCRGDFDGDGDVDGVNLSGVASRLGQTVCP